MEVESLRLSGLKRIRPKIFADQRGFFFETYRQPMYTSFGIDPVFVQDNLSFSKKGTLRALHYQSTPGQAKLISCLQGKIFDVAVDIRPGSSTFGEWEGVELDDENNHQLFIPIGFAHGYCVLSETALVHYKVSSVYHSDTECSLRWNDPRFNIKWPIQDPILSERDQRSPFSHEVFA